MPDPVDITHMRQLEAAARPAPWDIDSHNHFERGCRCLCCYDPSTLWHTSNMLDCEDVPVPEGLDQERCEMTGLRYEDAVFITSMRNNLPALLDELETLRRQLAAIKAADPDLFDPEGGNRRGRAYETYGSAGHHLREAYLDALGLI